MPQERIPSEVRKGQTPVATMALCGEKEVQSNDIELHGHFKPRTPSSY